MGCDPLLLGHVGTPKRSPTLTSEKCGRTCRFSTPFDQLAVAAKSSGRITGSLVGMDKPNIDQGTLTNMGIHKETHVRCFTREKKDLNTSLLEKLFRLIRVIFFYESPGNRRNPVGDKFQAQLEEHLRSPKDCSVVQGTWKPRDLSPLSQVSLQLIGKIPAA